MVDSLSALLPDKRQVRASFDRAAPRYDEVALLQREVGERLVERLDEVRLTPNRVLDLGAGTGVGTVALVRRYPKAQVVALDLAPGMLRTARQRLEGKPLLWPVHWQRQWRHWFGQQATGFTCGDAEQLPFVARCFDLIHSNLTLQWCTDLDKTFTELRRVAASGALLSFTTFGPDTLKELRAAWQAVDQGNHVNTFLDMHDVGDALARAGFSGILMDVERLTVTYDHLTELMGDLKILGAHNVTQGRPRGLMGRERLRRLVDTYETYRYDGRLPASYEVVYGHAWAEQPVQQVSKESNLGSPVKWMPSTEYKKINN